ncbi:MAG: hypothetical protein HY457_03405 [Parcubacteria group bacterium]|nr:hypothetical protein [Parcubacteria group bacterium]
MPPIISASEQTAQTALGSARELIFRINELVFNPVIAILFGIAVVVFLWGVVEFIWKSNEETAREHGREHIMWGLIGMFIMVAVFSIIHIIARTFGLDIPATIR